MNYTELDSEYRPGRSCGCASTNGCQGHDLGRRSHPRLPAGVTWPRRRGPKAVQRSVHRGYPGRRPPEWTHFGPIRVPGFSSGWEATDDPGDENRKADATPCPDPMPSECDEYCRNQEGCLESGACCADPATCHGGVRDENGNCPNIIPTCKMCNLSVDAPIP